MTHRCCVLIPTYNNPRTIEKVVRAVQAHLPDVVVVDDGGSEDAKAALVRVAAMPGVELFTREVNGGKGAAVKDGLRHAKELGFTHALQVDADGQHDVDDIPKLLEASRGNPAALVLAKPVFDETAPKARLWGRKISVFWAWAETLFTKQTIADPLCGFRVYPLDVAVKCGARGDRMDFDPEIAVRMVWHGAPVINVDTKVRYVAEEDGGISHFRVVHDNVLISLVHARLFTIRMLGLWRWL